MSGEAMRVLIAAENASTRMGGEAILPYHYFRLLRARGVDAHLIVHARTRDDLARLFANDLDQIHFVEDTALQRLFFRLGKMLPRRVDEATLGLLNQMLTQRAQRGILRQLASKRCVVHQPTPVSPRFPSLIYDVGAPVVIGPLNGGMEYPRALRDADGRLTRLLIAVGRSLSEVANGLIPGKLRAAVVLVANARTRAVLPAGLSGRVLEIPENAVDTSQWTPIATGG